MIWNKPFFSFSSIMISINKQNTLVRLILTWEENNPKYYFRSSWSKFFVKYKYPNLKNICAKSWEIFTIWMTLITFTKIFQSNAKSKTHFEFWNKQPPEVFCKKSCSWKFRKIFLWILKKFEEHFFTEHLWATASVLKYDILHVILKTWERF